MESLSELDQLHALGDKKFKGRRGQRSASTLRSGREKVRTVPRHHASRSGAATEQYLNDWESAYKEMGGTDADDPFGRRRKSSQGIMGLECLAGSSAFGSYPVPRTLQSWRKSPKDPRGILCNLSDRPLLCMSLSHDAKHVVVGSSDHALYVVDIESGRKTRTLYNKRNGHSEWVTCVSYTPDGRVLSGGLDSKLLLWSARGCIATELNGHRGSISFVHSNTTGDYAISGGYDKTVRIWNIGGRNASESCSLVGHKGSVLCAAWDQGAVLSGDRSGDAVLWDLTVGSSVRHFSGHRGHVTSCALYAEAGVSSSTMCLTGGQDGRVRVWDPRAQRPAAIVIEAHTTKDGGTGAVSDICATKVGDNDLGHIGGNVVVTAGADKTIRVLDPRGSFAPRARFDHHRDFIYSLKVAGSLAISGGGDGLLLVHDLKNGKLCYGLGANRAAVRCIETTERKLIAAGDDGSAIVFEF
eukprot:g4419.t1